MLGVMARRAHRAEHVVADAVHHQIDGLEPRAGAEQGGFV